MNEGLIAASDLPSLRTPEFLIAFYLVTGLVVALIVTRPIIAWLKSRQLGKAIRVDGPDHSAKAGTPTMGGVGMLGILILGALWIAREAWSTPEGSSALGFKMVALVAASMLVFATFGLVDDLAGLARRKGRKELGVGLGARQMLVLQVLASAGLSGLALKWLGVDTVSGSMFYGPAAFPIVFILAMLGLLGTVNGVNLSDGLDGLASGLLAIAFAASAWILTLLSGDLPIRSGISWMDRDLDIHIAIGTITPLAALAAGACLGFLWYNRHPARVFMGNVASMGLGGALAMMFIVSGFWWLLPVVGAVFVAEVLSVIIQVGYFKWSGGKRVFRMAPLHHHFELGGMHETQVVRRFWIAGALSGLLAIALFVRFVA